MRRPLVLTVLGILSLIYAALAGLGNLMASLGFVLSRASSAPGSQQAAWYTGVPAAPAVIVLVLCWAATICLAAGGVGLLMQKRWGRTLSIAFAVSRIVATVLILAAQYHWQYTPQMELARQVETLSPQASQNFEQTARAGMSRTVAASLLGLVYPVVILAFMFGPKMGAATAKAGRRTGP